MRAVRRRGRNTFGWRFWVCGWSCGSASRGKATRDLAGESAASDTTTVWILAVVWEELERAEHEAGARYSSGMVAWPGSDGTRRGDQHLGAVSLGTNWSGVVTLKNNHELIRKGLYRWIRHPIYTGILLAMIGTALIKGHLRGWLGFLVVWAAFYFKARREEGSCGTSLGADLKSTPGTRGCFCRDRRERLRRSQNARAEPSGPAWAENLNCNG